LIIRYHEQIKIPDDFFGIVHTRIAKIAEEYRLLDEMGVNRILRIFYKAGGFDNLDFVTFHPYAVNLGVLLKLWYPTKTSLYEFPSYAIIIIAGSTIIGATVILRNSIPILFK